MLTVEQVNENAETYLRQFFKIVDREQTEIRPRASGSTPSSSPKSFSSPASSPSPR